VCLDPSHWVKGRVRHNSRDSKKKATPIKVQHLSITMKNMKNKKI
jgi:hypothetical protein